MKQEQFFEYLVRRGGSSYAQLAQDLWVLARLDHPKSGYFIEIGAYDGVNISNTMLLELAGWDGLLVEPNPRAFAALSSARRATGLQKCVWTLDDEKIEFQSVLTRPELSRMSQVANDLHDTVGLRSFSETIEVDTIHPSTMLRLANAPAIIDYLSIDTEGTEYDILSAFPFDDHQVRLISVEHNYGEQREAIHELLKKQGFRRELTSFSEFDDWYVDPLLVPTSTAEMSDAEGSCYERIATATDAPLPGKGVTPLLLRIANQLLDAKRFDEARRLLETQVKRRPIDVAALRGLANLEIAAGHVPAAQAALQQAVQVAPHMLAQREDLAALYLKLKQPEQAIELVRANTDAGPTRKRAAGIAARAFLQIGKIEESAEMTRRACDDGWKPGRFAVNLSRRLRKKGAVGDAVSLLRSAMGADPSNVELNAMLIDTLIEFRRDGGSVGPAAPLGNEFEKRIAIAKEGVFCVADIPKVPGAGDVIEAAGGRFQRMYDGTLVPEHGYYGDWMTRLIAQLDGHHEPQEERIFQETLDHLDGGFLLELGAYWGFYSTAFLRRFGKDAEATMVEPDVRNIAIGLETLRANGVRADVQLGVVPPIPPVLRNQPLNQGVRLTPPTFNVADFMSTSGRSEITVLHADIQGAEIQLMRDIAELLERREIRYLFISTHGKAEQLAVLRAIRRAGYFLIAEHDCLESFSFDGLVVACAPNVEGPGFIDLPLRRAATTGTEGIAPKCRPNDQKIQVIKLYGHGFWANVEHTVWQIVIAETLNRKPIAHWGTESYYGDGHTDTFSLYFKPLSDVDIEDIRHRSYYPKYWNANNIFHQLPEGLDSIDIAQRRSSWLRQQGQASSDSGRLDVLRALDQNCDADALVAMNFVNFEEIRPKLPDGSRYKTESVESVRRQIYRKYFSLQDDVAKEINRRRQAIIPPGGPIAAVHSRASDKHELEGSDDHTNQLIMNEAAAWLERTGGRLFLMTESEIERQKYMNAFGAQVLSQECFRSEAPLTPNFQHPDSDGFESGLSILTDTVIGANCDYFIGSSWSNVSRYLIAISDLTTENIRLFD